MIKKELAAGQLHKIQDKNEVTRAAGEAADVKRSLRQVHRQRHPCERSWTQASFTNRRWPQASSTKYYSILQQERNHATIEGS